MKTHLFREKAIAGFLRPSTPGSLVAITPPWTLAVFAVAIVLSLLLFLAVTFGRAEVVVSGRGVVRPNQPPLVLYAPIAGTVQSIPSTLRTSRAVGRAGDDVFVMDVHEASASQKTCAKDLATERADLAGLEKRLEAWNDSTGARDAAMALVVIAQIRSEREKVNTLTQRCAALDEIIAKSVIKLPADGSITELFVSAGAQVKVGDKLATVMPASANLVGYLALPETQRWSITPGQTVRMHFDALPSEQVGAGVGRITRVVDALPTGIKIEVPESDDVFAEVSIDGMPRGADAARAGMTFSADVLTGQKRIAALLFAGDD